ncbi:MAG: iron-sulfur cluster assembly protein [Euryarchaeota archaeon]|nr:iron-sulfur cluster assembly protein [Euryarchaeota archaeon]
MVDEDQVSEALRKVISVHEKKDIVTLGLIEEIVIDGGRVNIKMRPRGTCPFSFIIAVRAEEEVKKLPGVGEVKVDVLL